MTRRRPEGDWSDEGRKDRYLTLANGLGRAAAAGDTELVRRLLAEGAEADGWVVGGRRALDLAVCAGHAEAVRLLLAAGADPRLDAGPYHETTPMALAAMNGHTEVARALLDAGTSPGGAGGGFRYVPLVLAATSLDSGNPELVDLLLDRGADIEERMKDCTALDWAAHWGFPLTVERLLARGAAVTERTFREGRAGQLRTAREETSSRGWPGPGPRSHDYRAVRALLLAARESR
ncbi:ankyrin repeat domain-containing protein [Streptomyces sp. NBC_01351]|uniref:ankyrin repeat domain-containing protein n=1 Tax=Streptomyces sp. NBC_01351 TaxID=2903833 RepID=UPI002E34921A|nr:ankyrin repeat domain-containing protein [Streptomyces sp. NBC_01351]